MTYERTLHCGSFPQLGAVRCCYSCHEDYDEYGYEMIFLYQDMDGVTAHICCAVANAIDEMRDHPQPHQQGVTR